METDGYECLRIVPKAQGSALTAAPSVHASVLHQRNHMIQASFQVIQPNSGCNKRSGIAGSGSGFFQYLFLELSFGNAAGQCAKTGFSAETLHLEAWS